MSELVTIVNWVAIAVLFFFVMALAFNPSKDGSGVGNFWLIVAVAMLVVVLTLTVLPFRWAKYVALVIVLIPFGLYGFDDFYSLIKRNFSFSTAEYDGSRYFPDPQRKPIAKAISFEEVEKLEGLLKKPVPLINDFQNYGRLTLLDYAARMYNPYQRDWPKAKQMMELLIAAGATINSIDPQRMSAHAGVIGKGSAAILQFFLGHGADPHARGPYKMRLLFEAILNSTEPTEKVQLLLNHGASLNETDTFDVETEQYSPLLFAAHIGRWPVCLLLIQKGADLHFKAPNGFTLSDYLDKQKIKYKTGTEDTAPEFNAVCDLVLKQK